MGQDIPQALQIGNPGHDKSEAIMLHSVDHPLAFSPTYFSLNIQFQANSPAVNVPLNDVALMVPLNPVEVNHTVTSITAPMDLTINRKVDMQNEKVNQLILPSEKFLSVPQGI